MPSDGRNIYKTCHDNLTNDRTFIHPIKIKAMVNNLFLSGNYLVLFISAFINQQGSLGVISSLDYLINQSESHPFHQKHNCRRINKSLFQAFVRISVCLTRNTHLAFGRMPVSQQKPFLNQVWGQNFCEKKCATNEVKDNQYQKTYLRAGGQASTLKMVYF
ncbi:hypothetical protein EGR_08278 [Echinococcus granulosus]|uniref:Uncharacterized protein n=1 Tax=Echinococcus granulosus TaxID=6210 RepID=W6UFF4_ECHGR|nr:hypothetical protein EGR_08278 [Echinococcus granulosus]EUB56872.1 hypothetical protein EGR_08278 [Echinococcus granulosus]